MAIAHEEAEDQSPVDPAYLAKVRNYNTKGRESQKKIPAAAGAPTPSTSTQPAPDKKTTAKNIPKSVETIESSSSSEEDEMSDVEPDDPPASRSPAKTAVVRPEPVTEERSTLDEDLMLSDSASEYDVSVQGEEPDVIAIDVAGIEVPSVPLVSPPPAVTSTSTAPTAPSSSPAAAVTTRSSRPRRPWERQPTRPAPLSTAVRRLRTVVEAPTPAPRPAPETFEHYRRRTKEVTANRIVCKATNYSLSVRQCVDDLTEKFTLRPEEQAHCTKSVRIARLSQKRLATLIRRQFRFAGNQATKDVFLNWLDDTLVDIEARCSDSDDN